MRGYPEGRYRDRAHYALQGEWRFPLFRRLGGAAFATAGDVAPKLDAFDLRDPKLSAGAGLRFRLTDEGAALRFDVAVTRDGMSYYAIVLQAF
jgi:outer membrane translocation and assembly module TamA